VSSVYKYADAIVSPLGATTAQNWRAMEEGRCAIERHEGLPGFPNSFWGALIPNHFWTKYPELEHFTKFERLMILAAQEALSHTDIDPSSDEVLFIVATTKGNIELIDPEQPHSYANDRMLLWKSAQLICEYFQNPHRPVVVSQACISAVSALLVGMELSQQSCYKFAIVIGADIFSRFTYSGFSSLCALAPERCKPFDASRQGLNLGEAAACMVLGTTPPKGMNRCVTLRYGVASNDAHHISAPSRTGEGLYRAIMNCLLHIETFPDFVSAHGTGTIYNDQMEAVALARAGLSHLPVTACKGYFGHTLGAAGMIDVILSAQCMEKGLLYPVMGFNNLGVTELIQVQRKWEKKEPRSCIKTAAGFGGNNAALVIEIQ